MQAVRISFIQEPVIEAVAFASAVSAIAVTRMGGTALCPFQGGDQADVAPGSLKLEVSGICNPEIRWVTSPGSTGYSQKSTNSSLVRRIAT